MAIENLADDTDLVPKFLALPSRLYADDPHWIPGDDRALRAELFDAASARSSGERPDSAHFVARVGGRIAARISAFANDALRDGDGERVGSLGFFEAEDDRTLVCDLVAHARAWLQTTHGITRTWGPLNRDIWHGYRCMISGYDTEPFAGEPYNLRYYPALFESAGGRTRFRWSSFEDTERRAVLATCQRGEAQRAKLLALGYRFVALEPSRLAADLRTLHRLITQSFGGFPAYTPIGEREFCQLFASLAPALAPGGAWFLQDPAGDCCGFAIALVDLAGALKAARQGGSQGGLGRESRDSRRALFHLVGVTPALAAEQPGVGRALVTQVLGQLLTRGFERYVAALICRGNSSRGLAGTQTSTQRRDYALYEWRS
jgi:hypothetical protein